MDSMFDINLCKDMRDTLENYYAEKDDLLLEDIHTLKNIFDDQNIENIYTNDSEINKLAAKYEKKDKKDNKVFLKEVLKNKEAHLLFTNYKDDINVSSKTNIKENVSIEKNINIAKEFMSKYNINMLKIFEDLKDNYHIRIIKSNPDNVGGYIYLLNNLRPYMVINAKENIYDASCIIHETAHVHHLQNSILKKPKYPYFFQEVYSNYMQMLFYKFAEDNDLYKDDIKCLKIKKLEQLKIYLNRIKYGLDKNKAILIKEDDYQYGYGIALALYYYNMYLDDPEMTEYYVDWFIKSACFFNHQDTLNRFAIDKEKIITKENINNFLK